MPSEKAEKHTAVDKALIILKLVAEMSVNSDIRLVDLVKASGISVQPFTACWSLCRRMVLSPKIVTVEDIAWVGASSHWVHRPTAVAIYAL